AILLVLRRLVYPNRWCDLQQLFSRSKSWMSVIFNTTITIIFEAYHPPLFHWDVQRLDQVCHQGFSEAIHEKTGVLPTFIGFIDSTVRANCRPSIHQRQVYNGHKQFHALKYQSVSTPNGIIVHLSGPF
ncbi:hypothetical protein DFS34DRAFT_569269, partial [Phlyctochytrium arcticum]